jgi:hypothetical protein
VRGATSQSANLQEWQDSAGTVLARVNPSGDIFARIAYVGTSTNMGMLNVNTFATANVGIAVRGQASQTADLQQWQNSAGTVLVDISAEGVLEAPLVQNAQTGTTYTTVLSDAGKLVELNNASAITVTVPTNATAAYKIGTQINLLQTGAGQVTVAGTSGVTVNATPGLKLRAQWSSATLIKRATDTWVLVGDLSA